MLERLFYSKPIQPYSETVAPISTIHERPRLPTLNFGNLAMLGRKRRCPNCAENTGSIDPLGSHPSLFAPERRRLAVSP